MINKYQDLISFLMNIFILAIYNFLNQEDYKLKLTVGDSVHILEEEADWYFGYVVSEIDVKGIFPKSYVHVKKCNKVDAVGLVSNEPSIATEITSVLREWGLHWKNLYVVSIERNERKSDWCKMAEYWTEAGSLWIVLSVVE